MSKKVFMKNIGVADLTASLTSYFKFNSDMTDTIDSQSPTTNVGTTYATGQISNSRVFNGSTEYALYAGNSKMNMSDGTNDIPFSIAFWAKADSTGGTEGRVLTVANETGASFQWLVTKNVNSFVLQLFSQSNNFGTDSKTYSIAITYNAWHHYAFTYDGSLVGGFKAYKNGVLVSSSVTVNTYTGMKNITPNYAIGRRVSQSFSYYKGEFDDLSVWKNRILTKREVYQLYIKGFNGLPII